MNLYLDMEDEEFYEGAVWCFYTNWIAFLMDKIDIEENLLEIRNSLEYSPSRSSREIEGIKASIKLSQEYETLYLQWLTLRRLHGYESPSKEDITNSLRGIR